MRVCFFPGFDHIYEDNALNIENGVTAEILFGLVFGDSS